MRYFNTSGPVVPEDHYHIPPLDRVNLAELRQLVDRKRYFVLHAPRQTGKTSALLALQDLLNADGGYRCVYVNVEGAATAREDVDAAIRTVLNELAEAARETLDDERLGEIWPTVLDRAGGHSALRTALNRWSRTGDKPLLLLIDEIDTLVGDSLLAVLRQLRDFSRDEVLALLGQHTEETGQPFGTGALDTVLSQTCGQPWLVNALAYETCFRGDLAADRSRPVTQADVFAAREQLVLRRDTHLDQLTDKLKEGRVRRVIEPLLVGGDGFESTADDIEYVQDLGLIARDPPMRLANPIYAEVVPRQLTWPTQLKLQEDPAWYVADDGALLLDKLLGRFQEFFREHSESWVERFDYREAGPHLLLQAFLQRIVNSGGRVQREHGLGRRRADLLIGGPRTSACASTWWSARFATTDGDWNARWPTAWSKPRRTWTSAGPKRATWSSSTATKSGAGTRRCSATDGSPTAEARSRSGGCSDGRVRPLGPLVEILA